MVAVRLSVLAGFVVCIEIVMAIPNLAQGRWLDRAAADQGASTNAAGFAVNTLMALT
jgi:hypothetical protein